MFALFCIVCLFPLFLALTCSVLVRRDWAKVDANMVANIKAEAARLERHADRLEIRAEWRGMVRLQLVDRAWKRRAQAATLRAMVA
jgi:hypothetical protein